MGGTLREKKNRTDFSFFVFQYLQVGLDDPVDIDWEGSWMEIDPPEIKKSRAAWKDSLSDVMFSMQ